MINLDHLVEDLEYKTTVFGFYSKRSRKLVEVFFFN